MFSISRGEGVYREHTYVFVSHDRGVVLLNSLSGKLMAWLGSI